jgi:hypothetical protein
MVQARHLGQHAAGGQTRMVAEALHRAEMVAVAHHRRWSARHLPQGCYRRPLRCGVGSGAGFPAFTALRMAISANIT